MNGVSPTVPDLVDRDDVRVIQRGQRPRLGAKPVETVGIGLRFRGEYLERHADAQLLVDGVVDHAHAAAVDGTHDAVARADKLAG